jgi:hypothetical protein
MYGICNLSIIPVRQQPSEKSEMVTQLLFGETYNVLDKMNGWLLIQSETDQYEGWIDEKIMWPVDETYIGLYKLGPSVLLDETVSEVVCENSGNTQFLVRGSTLPLYNNGKFTINDQVYKTNGRTQSLNHIPDPHSLVHTALKYLQSPYLWGGRSPFGIDCSGFVQAVFRFCGYSLPRDASQQVKLGEGIDFISAVQPGDLAFFENNNGAISHVGILLSPQQIIHASGCVKIDPIDHQGIFSQQSGKYTHSLRIIKRITIV